MSNAFGIRARISLLSSEDGGRKTPLFSGYRAGVFLDSHKKAGNDAVMTLEGKELCRPGETCQVRLDFLHPELLEGPFAPTSAFVLREGARTIARGEVVEILKPNDRLPSSVT